MLSPLLQSSLESIFWIAFSSKNIFSLGKYKQNPVTGQNGYLQFGNHRVQRNHLGPGPATGCRSRCCEDTYPSIGNEEWLLHFLTGQVWLCPVCPWRHIQMNPWPQQPFKRLNSKYVTSIFIFYFQNWGFSLFHCHSKVTTVSLPVTCQLILPAINALALGFRVWDSGSDLQLLCGLTEWPSSSCAFSPCLRHFHTIVVMILDSL